MIVYIVGGTGLLGSAAAAELIARGHRVKAISLGPPPTGFSLPPGMEIEYRSFLGLSGQDIDARLAGCDALVFAAGVDERVEFPAPVYDQYLKYNVEPVDRIFASAARMGHGTCRWLGSGL